jgi:valyl-tRNA synthetase
VPLADRWLFARLKATLETVNSALTSYRFHEASQSIYEFFWGDFCDWYIEWVKPELQSADRERAIVAWKNLFAAFESALRLLHPVMPFLTEELWHQLPQESGAKSIALAAFPEAKAEWANSSALEEFALLQSVITEIRNIRAQMKIDAKRKVSAEFSSQHEGVRKTVSANLDGISRLAVLSDLKVSAEHLQQVGGGVRSTSVFDVRIAYADAVDRGAELVRLRKETDRLTKDIASKERQLADDTFRSRAPEKIVKGIEATLEERKVELSKLSQQLEQLEASA